MTSRQNWVLSKIDSLLHLWFNRKNTGENGPWQEPVIRRPGFRFRKNDQAAGFLIILFFIGFLFCLFTVFFTGFVTSLSESIIVMISPCFWLMMVVQFFDSWKIGYIGNLMVSRYFFPHRVVKPPEALVTISLFLDLLNVF